MGFSEKSSFEGIMKFDGDNCGFWKIHIKDYLTYKNVHKTLKEWPPGMTDEE